MCFVRYVADSGISNSAKAYITVIKAKMFAAHKWLTLFWITKMKDFPTLNMMKTKETRALLIYQQTHRWTQAYHGDGANCQTKNDPGGVDHTTMIRARREKKDSNIVFLIPNILEMKPEGREPAVAPAETKDSIHSLGSSVMMTLSLVVVCRYVLLQGPTSADILPPQPPTATAKQRAPSWKVSRELDVIFH